MSAAAPPSYPTDDGAAGFNHNRLPSKPTVNGGEKEWAHIDDLKRQALTGYNPNGSVHQLLENAELSLGQAGHLLNYRRPDLSYIEYLRAFEIVVGVVPHNKGWPDLQMDHQGGGMQKYHLLQKRINGMADQYNNIKDIIVNNNMRSGIQPKANDEVGHERSGSGALVNGSSLNGATAALKIKPSPSPKPESLHGKVISTASASSAASGPVDPLKDRLAALRNRSVPIDTGRSDSRMSNSSSHNSPISLPNANEFGGRASYEALYRTSSGSAAKPQGPRGMPNGNAGPPLPGKLPLQTHFGTAMPQEPKATYSPARNMHTVGNIDLPRQTPRSLASTSTRRTSVAPTSSASSHAPNGKYSSESGEYFPSPTISMTNGGPPSQLPRRKSVHIPKETRISAERLYDYLDRYNILLIDFRARQDFDLGHIYSRNVICIDPLHVSQGMSAEQLLDRMVIGPEIEQEMFMNRDKFELVVYYDAQTQSETFLSRPIGELQTKLKYLHEALFEFNVDKQLQRPPILLIGGIDAWADLVGNQALKTSDTLSQAKQGRPIQRRPVAGTGQLRVGKKRLRDYNPLDDEEEQKWRERARAESVVLPTPPGILEQSGDAIDEEDEDGQEEPNSAIREFLDRFPDAGNLEKHAFGPLQPHRAPPAPPPKLPMYPMSPPTSTYHSAPARPAPAAPRMSYTGVSDRAGSQNVPAARSSSLAPYIPAKYLSNNFRLPKTGLENFGTTCYMNSTLQALSATFPMSIYFFEEEFRRTLQRENWKGTNGIMSELYSNVMKSLWKNDVNYIRPSTFRNFCARQNKTWGRNDEEQDAEEFLRFLIDCLHEDLNWTWSRTPLRELTEQEEVKREKMPRSVVAKVEWDRYTHRNQSFIMTLFGGQYSSRLYFDTCGHTSTTHDFLWSLSVEIPEVPGRYPSLDDCLRSYCKQERLVGDERPKCTQCNELRNATKQLDLTRAPQFLIIHFKRFRTQGRNARKIDTPINFPLENFDLEPYMIKQPSPADTQAIVQNFGPEYAKPDPSMTPPYRYDAYAVVRHIGSSLHSGHYKALVRDRTQEGTWRCFNDRKHEDFIPGRGDYTGGNDVRNGQAYIVFYQRTMTPTSQLGPGGVGKI